MVNSPGDCCWKLLLELLYCWVDNGVRRSVRCFTLVPRYVTCKLRKGCSAVLWHFDSCWLVMETGVDLIVLIPNPTSPCHFPVFYLCFYCQNGEALGLGMARGSPLSKPC